MWALTLKATYITCIYTAICRAFTQRSARKEDIKSLQKNPSITIRLKYFKTII